MKNTTIAMLPLPLLLSTLPLVTTTLGSYVPPPGCGLGAVGGVFCDEAADYPASVAAAVSRVLASLGPAEAVILLANTEQFSSDTEVTGNKKQEFFQGHLASRPIKTDQVSNLFARGQKVDMLLTKVEDAGDEVPVCQSSVSKVFPKKAVNIHNQWR